MSEALAARPPVRSTISQETELPDDGHAISASEAKSAGGEVIGLLSELAGEAAGLDVIYEALSRLASLFGLEDIVVAVDNRALGLQAFRLERRTVGATELELLRGGETFLSVPDVVPPVLKRLAVAITEVALATQLTERRHIRDPITGLPSRGVFNESLRAAAAQSSRYGWTFTVLVIRAGVAPHTEAELRRLGHAFARALRSGDTGTRIRNATFAALLPNATSESLYAFVRRFSHESGTDEHVVTYASATAPNESVDPVELFRLAAARMHVD